MRSAEQQAAIRSAAHPPIPAGPPREAASTLERRPPSAASATFPAPVETGLLAGAPQRQTGEAAREAPPKANLGTSASSSVDPQATYNGSRCATAQAPCWKRPVSAANIRRPVITSAPWSSAHFRRSARRLTLDSDAHGGLRIWAICARVDLRPTGIPRVKRCKRGNHLRWGC